MGSINHHYVKKEWMKTALQWPIIVVATDALLTINLAVKTNSNIAGTFS
jgi:hypothetical protein